MEFPSQNANSPSPNPSLSNEDMNQESNRENNPYMIPQPLDDREYGCKYCYKKFSNKQALGGHQNAHKIERAMEKSARDQGRENNFAYFGANPSYHGMTSTPNFVGSFNRSHDFMNRASINRPYSQFPMHHGVHFGYYGRPGSFGPHPVPGFNSAHSGWALPTPGAPQFTTQPSYIQNRAIIPPFPIIDSGSSSARQNFNGLSMRLDGNLGGDNNNQINDPKSTEIDDPNLDLSLKL